MRIAWKVWQVVALTLAALSALSASVRAEIWSFEPNTSVVRFTYGHLGLSRQSGTVTGIKGQLQFDPTQPDRGQVLATLYMATLSTGVAKLDDLLKSSDFFDVERYPTITFKSTGTKPLIGDRTGQVTGDLTIMGVTRPVVLTVKWNFTGEHPLASVNPTYTGKWVSGFSATAVINRSDFGLTRGLPLIDERVAIDIEVELLRLG
ncbi:MAG: hypothetical protein RLZ98_542 [Pseudomonadota bacterium]|jgi:polyisoprenoid-binding protein YceI